MIKSWVLAAVTSVGVLIATGANAGVSWSVNVDALGIGTVISGGPGYYGPGYGRFYGPAPVYEPVYQRPYERAYERAPIYVPAPVYRVLPPVAYYPPAVVYRPVPVVYPRPYPYYRAGWRHGHDRWDGYGHR